MRASNIWASHICRYALVPPKIGEVEKDVTVKAGQTLEVVIPYEAYPEPTADVSQDGESLPGDAPYTIRVQEGVSTFKQSKLSRPAQCGTYSNKLQNPYGVDTVDINVNVIGRSLTQ